MRWAGLQPAPSRPRRNQYTANHTEITIKKQVWVFDASGALRELATSYGAVLSK